MIEDRLEQNPEGVEGLGPILLGISTLATVVAIPVAVNSVKKIITGSSEKQQVEYYRSVISANLSQTPPSVVAIYTSLGTGDFYNIKSVAKGLNKTLISPSASLHNLILITDKTGKNLILAGSATHIAQTYTDKNGVTDYVTANRILDEANQKNKLFAGFLGKVSGFSRWLFWPFRIGKTYYQNWKEELSKLQKDGAKLSPLTAEQGGGAIKNDMIPNLIIIGGVGLLMLLTYIGIRKEMKKNRYPAKRKKK